MHSATHLGQPGSLAETWPAREKASGISTAYLLLERGPDNLERKVGQDLGCGCPPTEASSAPCCLYWAVHTPRALRREIQQ